MILRATCHPVGQLDAEVRGIDIDRDTYRECWQEAQDVEQPGESRLPVRRP